MNEALIVAISSAIALLLREIFGQWMALRKGSKEARKEDHIFVIDQHRAVIELQSKQLQDAYRQLGEARETIDSMQFELGKVYGAGDHVHRNALQTAQIKIESMTNLVKKVEMEKEKGEGINARLAPPNGVE